MHNCKICGSRIKDWSLRLSPYYIKIEGVCTSSICYDIEDGEDFYTINYEDIFTKVKEKLLSDKEDKYIPIGDYCYEIIYSPDDFDGLDKCLVSYRCPYWDFRGPHLAVGNGYCHFLERGDFDFDPYDSHIWDELKMCKVRRDKRTYKELEQERKEFMELIADYTLGGRNSELIGTIQMLMSHLKGTNK